MQKLTRSNSAPKLPLEEFQLRVVEARGLFGGDVTSASDPFVMVKLKGLAHILKPEKQLSGVVWNNNNPVWNQDFLLHPTKTNDRIVVQVFDKDRAGRSKYLGKADIPAAQFHNRGLFDLWLPLVGKRGVNAPGEIHIVGNYGSGSFGQNFGDNGLSTSTGYLPTSNRGFSNQGFSDSGYATQGLANSSGYPTQQGLTNSTGFNNTGFANNSTMGNSGFSNQGFTEGYSAPVANSSGYPTQQGLTNTGSSNQGFTEGYSAPIANSSGYPTQQGLTNSTGFNNTSIGNSFAQKIEPIGTTLPQQTAYSQQRAI